MQIEFMEHHEKPDKNGFAVEYSDAKKSFIDIAGFLSALAELNAALGKTAKRDIVQKMLNDFEWQQHYESKRSGAKVLSENGKVEYAHEHETAFKLADQGYYVVFVPKGLFNRHQKRYDVILLKGHVKLDADLKSVTSTNIDTIAKRIRGGSEQACRVILDIRSDIANKDLIRALRSASFRNDLLKEVWLFHKRKFYILPKNLIVSTRIYAALK